MLDPWHNLLKYIVSKMKVSKCSKNITTLTAAKMSRSMVIVYGLLFLALYHHIPCTSQAAFPVQPGDCVYRQPQETCIATQVSSTYRGV